MDLRGGISVWDLKPEPTAAFPALEGNDSCDVAVVGGGISGAMIASHLARSGMDVVVVDRREPGRGSTAATTALIQYELDTPLRELRKLVGRVMADRAYALCYEALDGFAEFARSLPSPCALQARPSLYLAGRNLNGEALYAEATARQEIGIDATFIGPMALREQLGVWREGGILSGRAYEVNPIQLHQACLADAGTRGARIYGHTTITRHEARPGGVRLISQGGATIDARRVVYAPGYEAPEILGDADFCVRHSTFAIATKPLPDDMLWPGRTLLWEASEPYFYARVTEDNRVIAGGEDETFVDPAKRDAVIAAKRATLEGRLAEWFPHMPFEVETAWAGTFARTADSLPCIGPVESVPDSLFALGYGGNGLLFSYVAAGLIQDLLAGGSARNRDLFTFDRPSLGRTRLPR